MIRPASLLLLAATTTTLSGQTATHKAAGTTAHRAPATAATTSAASKADNPPGVPPVTTPPKALYTLRYVDIVTGTGPLAVPEKYYTVKYTGWLTDGTKFDSSYDHPGQEPITFPYGAHRVIPGWDTGFTGMRVGGKRRLYIPYQLAYGEAGREGAIPPKADLIFDIELINFADTPPAPPAAAAPATSSQPAGNPTQSQPGTATPPPDAPSAQPQSQPQSQPQTTNPN